MAIRGGTTILSAANHANMINLYTERFADRVSLEVRSDHTPGYFGDWRDYVAGVISLLSRHQQIGGADLYVSQSSGTAGLSSSASFSLALAKSLAPDVDNVSLARICQQVEHEYAGVQCGIMDQMSIALGGVIYLDCRDLRWQEASKGFEDVAIVVMDTCVERTLAGSAYNERVNELYQIAEIDGLENIDSLVTAPASDYLPDFLLKRYRHITTEERRVRQAFEAINQQHWHFLGELMMQSHASLRDDYEVSCDELDLMVDLAIRERGVLGARMTGGGFGGCAIALTDRQTAELWMPQVARDYERKTGIAPRLFVAETAPGLSRWAVQG